MSCHIASRLWERGQVEKRSLLPFLALSRWASLSGKEHPGHRTAQALFMTPILPLLDVCLLWLQGLVVARYNGVGLRET